MELECQGVRVVELECLGTPLDCEIISGIYVADTSLLPTEGDVVVDTYKEGVKDVLADPEIFCEILRHRV